MATYKPTDGMITAAKRGLEWRREYGRGGTAVGVARARDISNGKRLSEDTVKRMYSFFSRHANNKAKHYDEKKPDGGPTAWRIAWDLWGGTAGFTWSRGITELLKKEDKERNIDETLTKDVEMTEEVIEAEAEVVEAIVDEIREVEVEETVEASEALEVEAEVAEDIEETVEEEDAGVEEASERFCAETIHHRATDMKAGAIDEETRRVKIAVSSEEPVERSFGKEILDHTEKSVDLSFAKSGRMPLLMDHDPKQQIGVVEDVTLDSSARVLRATVRFGKNGMAKEIFDDVIDKIRSNISVGYQVNKMQREGEDSYRVNSWKVHEVSLVSIPADTSVGVGRAKDTSIEPKIETIETKETIMSEIDINVVAEEARSSRNKEVASIIELGAKHSRSDMAAKAVAENKSLDQFRGELLDVIGEKPLETAEVGLTKKEVREFSVMRAIRAMANPSDRQAQEEARFEMEVSEAAQRATGRQARGVMLPTEVLRSWTRDLNTSDDSALIAQDFRGGDFIDVLRNASSVMAAGATILNGLQGSVAIPKKSAASSAGWIATEGAASAESEPTFGQVTMSPKVVGAHTQITRLMMQQSSLDIENLIRNDLAQGIALAIDNGALQGSGASGQPTGIKNTAGINAPTAFAGATPTFAEVVAMETAVAEDNALLGNLAYILPASMYGALKTALKDAGSGQFVVGPDGQINGYNAIVSNQVTAGDLFFGNFADALIGLYGGLDIVVDPYSNSTSGTVNVTALQTCDVAVRHAVSFAVNNDGV